MMDWIKKQGAAAWCVLAAAVLGLAAVIIYIVNSTTGFMAGTPVNGLIIALSFIAVIGLAAAVVFSEKLDGKIVDLILFAAAIMLIASLLLFIMARISIISDVYFNPVNFPQAEADTLNVSFAGIAFYVLSIAAIVAGTFFEKMTKKA